MGVKLNFPAAKVHHNIWVVAKTNEKKLCDFAP
jgi:hypothetical protein